MSVTTKNDNVANDMKWLVLLLLSICSGTKQCCIIQATSALMMPVSTTRGTTNFIPMNHASLSSQWSRSTRIASGGCKKALIFSYPSQLFSSPIIRDDGASTADRMNRKSNKVESNEDESVSGTTASAMKLRSFRRIGGRNRWKTKRPMWTSSTRGDTSIGNEKKQIKREMKHIIRKRVNHIKDAIKERLKEKQLMKKVEIKLSKRSRPKRFLWVIIALALFYQIFFGGSNNKSNADNSYYYYQSSSYIEKRVYAIDGSYETDIQRNERFDSNIPGLNDRIRVTQQQQNLRSNDDNDVSSNFPYIIRIYGNY